MPIGLPTVDLDNFLKIMAKTEKWEYPDIDGLRGKKYKHLSELRWKSGRVPHRILGYTQAAFEFVMLIGCTHNGKKYTPPTCMDTAVRYYDELQNGKASTCEYELITSF